MTLIESSSSRVSRKNLRWWLEEKDKAHEVVTTWFDTMRDRPAATERRKQFLLYASLYGNIPVLGFGLNSYTRNITASNRISLNVIQNGIDTLVAKVTKQRPKPTFETVKGDYEMRERAEACSDYVQGTFYARNLYEVRPYVCLDSLIFGLGSYKVHTEPGELVYERSYPFEAVIDDREAMYGKPRCRGQRKYLDKQVAIEMFAREEEGLSTEEKARREVIRDAIEKGGTDAGDREEVDYDDSSDQILVYEIWHLRSGPKASDGKHCICVRGATCLFEDYNEDDFPFEDLRPMRQWAGFWGIGLAEKGAGLQAEINRILRDIQASMHLLSKPHWMVPASANVVTAHLNNDIATIIKYQGAVAPTVYTPQAMSADVFNHLQWLVRSFYEEHGISTLSAKSQKPAGLDSGVALETYLDVESERFTDFIKNDEASIKGLAEKTIRAVRTLGNPEVKTIGKGDGYRKLRLKDVDLGEERAIRIFPTSMLPDTPAGKLQFVSTMIKGQMLPSEDAFDLIDWPDTAQYAKRRGAPRRVIEHNIARMKRGEEAAPEPLDDHKLALRIVTEAYHEAREEGVPEDRLALFRRYLTLTEQLNRPAPAAAPPVAPPVGDMPAGPAAPMAPPGPAGPPPGAPPAPMPPPNGVLQ